MVDCIVDASEVVLDSVVVKVPVCTIKHNNCTIHNSTILTFETQTQHNNTTAIVQYCTIDEIFQLQQRYQSV